MFPDQLNAVTFVYLEGSKGMLYVLVYSILCACVCLCVFVSTFRWLLIEVDCYVA